MSTTQPMIPFHCDGIYDPNNETVFDVRYTCQEQPELTSKLRAIHQGNIDFRSEKTAAEIIEKHGTRPIKDITELYPEKPVWDSDEEFLAFVETIGDNPNDYRSNLR